MEFFKNQKEIQNWNQDVLNNTHVLIVGVGGIGSIAALACARLGIGRISLCDMDTVEPSNLNRQLLYGTHDIGKQKIESALINLSQIHSLTSYIEGFDFDIFQNWKKFINLVKKADIVYNALDLPEVKKLLVANLCLKLRKPMIFSGTDPISGNAGMILFQQPDGSPCYNCLTAAIHSVKEEYRPNLDTNKIDQYDMFPVEQMADYNEILGKTTVYTASIITMFGIDLMIHWLFRWFDSFPNRIILDLYNFTCETWIETNSCQFCQGT